MGRFMTSIAGGRDFIAARLVGDERLDGGRSLVGRRDKRGRGKRGEDAGDEIGRPS